MTQPTFSASRHREGWLEGAGRLEADSVRWREATRQNLDAELAALDPVAVHAYHRGRRGYAPHGLFSIREQETCMTDGADRCLCQPDSGGIARHCDLGCVEYHTDACMDRGRPSD